VSEGKTEGEVVFRGEKLFWKKGAYEFRYHHNGMHNVMAISPPFHITIEKCEAVDQASIEQELVRLFQTIAEQPVEPTQNFIPQHPRRIAYSIKCMFGVEFSDDVIRSDANIQKLTARIYQARRILSPSTHVEPRSITVTD